MYYNRLLKKAYLHMPAQKKHQSTPTCFMSLSQLKDKSEHDILHADRYIQ